jgi:hypothetical protein
LSNQALGPLGSDFLVAVITTQETDPLRIAIEPQDLASGTLAVKSYVRPLAIYPVNVSDVGQVLGHASANLMKRVTGTIKWTLDN